jgi:hypothetical protein
VNEAAADACPCDVAAIVIGSARPARIGISHVFRRTTSPGSSASRQASAGRTFLVNNANRALGAQAVKVTGVSRSTRLG